MWVEVANRRKSTRSTPLLLHASLNMRECALPHEKSHKEELPSMLFKKNPQLVDNQKVLNYKDVSVHQSKNNYPLQN
jgi:hypothetical protein